MPNNRVQDGGLVAGYNGVGGIFDRELLPSWETEQAQVAEAIESKATSYANVSEADYQPARSIVRQIGSYGLFGVTVLVGVGAAMAGVTALQKGHNYGFVEVVDAKKAPQELPASVKSKLKSVVLVKSDTSSGSGVKIRPDSALTTVNAMADFMGEETKCGAYVQGAGDTGVDSGTRAVSWSNDYDKNDFYTENLTILNIETPTERTYPVGRFGDLPSAPVAKEIPDAGEVVYFVNFGGDEKEDVRRYPNNTLAQVYNSEGNSIRNYGRPAVYAGVLLGNRTGDKDSSINVATDIKGYNHRNNGPTKKTSSRAWGGPIFNAKGEVFGIYKSTVLGNTIESVKLDYNINMDGSPKQEVQVSGIEPVTQTKVRQYRALEPKLPKC